MDSESCSGTCRVVFELEKVARLFIGCTTSFEYSSCVRGECARTSLARNALALEHVYASIRGGDYGFCGASGRAGASAAAAPDWS